MKMSAKRVWRKLGLFLMASLALALSCCSSDSPSPYLAAGTNSGNTLLTSSSGRLTVTVRNNSGRTVYVKFTGNPLNIDQNDLSISAGGSLDFSLTSVTSGRIFISYDKALSSDAPDGANSGDPDYRTRFDKIELSYDQGGGGKANLTAVDFYAIPMILETSIQGTTIDHMTLAGSQTGNTVEAAITGILSDPSSAVIKNAGGTETVRILSPVKCPQAYSSFDTYLNTLNGSTLSISGTFYGVPSQNYSYTGTIGTANITLGNGSHTINVPMTSLKSGPDLLNNNGIYTCNSPYTVDGSTHHVGDNDIYAAVYRDLVTGFNLGFVKTGANDSTGWWQSTPFQGTSYNWYAKVIADNYPGAYGFPFTDRYTHILADLGGMIDTMTITILGDNTSPAPYTPQGITNPQSGAVRFNLILVTADENFSNTTFQFDTQSYNGGYVYTFPTARGGSACGGGVAGCKSAQINNVPAQDGLNIYSLLLGGKKYSVFLKVDSGAVIWGSIAGGGSANWSAPNLFVGL